jgi:putative thiamine transport system ATP-binding protein
MALSLEDVALTLQGRPLIGPLDLTVMPGEIVTLMGPSGCGKSSLLDLLCGSLAHPLSGHGRLRLNGRDLAPLPPERRRIGRLFQDDLLFPHMTVAENLLFGMPRGPAAARVAKMQAALAQIGLPDLEERAPHQLSGGQRSRVALMRCLLAEPEAVLLDEPFAKLDEDLRQSVRHLVFGRVREAGLPGLLVTHDRADAPNGGRVLRIQPDGSVTDV